MPDKDEAKRIATEAGLPKLADEHLAVFMKSRGGTRDLTARLPKDLHWSEEPAIALSLVPGKRREA